MFWNSVNASVLFSVLTFCFCKSGLLKYEEVDLVQTDLFLWLWCSNSIDIYLCKHKHFPCVHGGNYQNFDYWQLCMLRCLKEEIVITREIYILPLSSCWPTRKFWQSQIMWYSHIMVSFQIGSVLSSALMPGALLFSMSVDAFDFYFQY